jgi:hypothetical protein
LPSGQLYPTPDPNQETSGGFDFNAMLGNATSVLTGWASQSLLGQLGSDSALKPTVNLNPSATGAAATAKSHTGLWTVLILAAILGFILWRKS